jgi:hypothetical protein
LDAVRTMCENAVWLDNGVVKASGPPAELIDRYVETAHADRVATAGGGARWGSGEIVVTRVELLDGGGTATLWVHTGEPATLRFHYLAREPVSRPVLGFGLHSFDGVHATGVNSRETLVPESIDGAGYVDFVVARMPLVAGSYDVTVALVDETNLHTFDFQTKAMRFDVGPGLPREAEGVFAIEGIWKFR